uniref:Cyclin-like domain-containing protein n=1 Tax=Bionectria ochroleuca TaxID=29856 RepID=A0A8H7K918_BIOOC
MSSFLTPAKKPAGSTASKPRFARPNPVRAMREREERRANAAASSRSSQFAYPSNNTAASLAVSHHEASVPTRPVGSPTNIVAEVQFGETSSGAAMVQGSFVAADQAGVRSMGPSFRRVGGSEDREKSIREAKGLMQGYAQQLNVSESFVTYGTQVFKLASSANFIQGRTLTSVAAVCLYAACRAEPPCKVMLIDLADLVQLNVFKLGRIFKKLNEVVPIGNDGLIPVYPEDLIWRFATKMEFHQETARVAEDAVRLVKRMSRDWMVMGRRPSGICGACLLMAARMHNFRRTVREVVYIVKVTNHTIQNRLSEFKVTESSRFLETSHDPPSFYRKTDEYRKLAEERSRKRKRLTNDDGADDDEGNDSTGRLADGLARQRRQSDAGGADLSKAPVIEYRPGENLSGNLDQLAHDFGDEIEKGLDEGSQQGSSRRRSQLPINEEWEQDEEELEGQIEEIFNDPLTYEHALAYSNAEQRARIHTHWALKQRPQKEVSMSADIDEDEFADDPEVINCLLSPDEARIKETIWVNQNKEWLRQHQEKVFRRKIEADRPKQTRRRRKRARMGEGQTSPASSAAEAAINVAKDRAWSKRINYDAIRSIFDNPNGGGLGSEATSRKTSMAGSTLGVAEDDEAPEQESVAGDYQEEEETYDYDETQEYEAGHGDEEFAGGDEFNGGYEDDDNPDMDAEYGLEEDEYR